ncbi:hypothetical protein P775_05700 [Puniceibacterium antarcticum]|uniref:O-antigen polymerase n=1 Tax=Puniceibacterium antarcticum TaxID=1206336 RepID=A0A2G8RHY0_9RHOB|nr:O-antigen ligase family protein [Puniceibacterium antarcticum]PIL21175.1 hypothetical protein P775_05700 [Puniceibacterium antarcticum]
MNGSADKVSRYFTLIFISLCVPMFFTLGGLYLSFSRLLLLAAFPYLFFKVYFGKCGRVVWTDIAMLLFVVALGASIFVNNRSVFITFVGSNAIIILGGYLAGRVFIRGHMAFISFIKLFGVIILLTLPFALYESQTSVMVIARLIDKLPLVSSSIDVNYPPRRGLYRVQVVFTHPIHYGLFSSMCFSLIFIGFRTILSYPSRIAWSACIALCCFLSVSSGPVLSMLVQVMLIAYGRLTLGVRNRWKILLGVSAFLYIILDLSSSRPAYFAIAERMAFDSHTAYVRKILLEYGLAQIGRTPYLGVGYNKWELPNYMSGSLDNYWLMTALVYGIPAFVFLSSAFLYTLIKVGNSDFSGETQICDIRLGWALVIVSLIFTLATVAIWSDIATLVFMFLGSGVWMIGYKPATSIPAQSPVPDNRKLAFTRFPNGTATSLSRREMPLEKGRERA